MSRLHASYNKRKNLIGHNMDSYYRIAFNCTKLLVWVALNSIFIVKRGKTLSLCGVNSFIFFIFFGWGKCELIWYVQVQYYTLGLSLKFNPRLVMSRKFRYRAPKTGAFTTCALLSRNYNARENSLQLPNLDTRNPPSNPEPKGPLVQIGAGYFCNTPYILHNDVPKSWFTPSHRLLFAIWNPRPP